MFAIDLYKALVAIKIPEETATQLVNSMNDHIDNRVTASVRPVLDRLDAMQIAITAQFVAQSGQIGAAVAEKDKKTLSVRWVVGIAVTVLLGGVPVAIAVLKVLGFLN